MVQTDFSEMVDDVNEKVSPFALDPPGSMVPRSIGEPG